MSWKYIEEFSANPDLNKLFGTYLNSITVNELTNINSWSKESIVQFPDPCPIHTKTSDIPMPTSATLPRGGVTIIGADTEPHSMNVDTDPIRTTLPEDETLESSFWTEFEGVAILVQNHGNHNFSCWKNGSVLCRFRFPFMHGIRLVVSLKSNYLEFPTNLFPMTFELSQMYPTSVISPSVDGPKINDVL